MAVFGQAMVKRQWLLLQSTLSISFPFAENIYFISMSTTNPCIRMVFYPASMFNWNSLPYVFQTHSVFLVSRYSRLSFHCHQNLLLGQGLKSLHLLVILFVYLLATSDDEYIELAFASQNLLFVWIPRSLCSVAVGWISRGCLIGLAAKGARQYDEKAGL